MKVNKLMTEFMELMTEETRLMTPLTQLMTSETLPEFFYKPHTSPLNLKKCLDTIWVNDVRNSINDVRNPAQV
jgi:hypothetical protein